MACREYDVELVVAVEPYKIAQWAKGVEDIEVERWNLDELKVHENVEVAFEVFYDIGGLQGIRKQDNEKDMQKI